MPTGEADFSRDVDWVMNNRFTVVQKRPEKETSVRRVEPLPPALDPSNWHAESASRGHYLPGTWPPNLSGPAHPSSILGAAIATPRSPPTEGNRLQPVFGPTWSSFPAIVSATLVSVRNTAI